MPVVELFVPGRPVPQPRPIQRATWKQKNHQVWGWRDNIAWAVKKVRHKSWPLSCTVGLGMEFTVSLKGRVGDLKNYITAVEDCLEGIVYKNDTQIDYYPFARRIRGERLGVRILVEWGD